MPGDSVSALFVGGTLDASYEEGLFAEAGTPHQPRENLLLLVGNMAAMKPRRSAAAICTHSLAAKCKNGLQSREYKP
jgi:hypothetical protein